MELTTPLLDQAQDHIKGAYSEIRGRLAEAPMQIIRIEQIE
jgi:hypothetical protein